MSCLSSLFMNSPVSFINTLRVWGSHSDGSECDNDIKWRGQTRTQSDGIFWFKMILDGEQVLEGVSKTFVRYPGEEHSAWLQRLTHLHCQNQVMADKSFSCTVHK